MTNAQIALMKRAIEAYVTADEPNHRLVEVGKINGVNPRTAQSLVDAGLLVWDMPSYAEVYTSGHVRLPLRHELENTDG
jgi:hypothetical protein